MRFSFLFLAVFLQRDKIIFSIFLFKHKQSSVKVKKSSQKMLANCRQLLVNSQLAVGQQMADRR